MSFIPIVHLTKEQADNLRADRRQELCDWIRSLGVRPEDIRPSLLIEHGDTSYVLHLSRFVRNDDGRMVLDRAANDVQSEPLVIDLGTAKSWPSWLGQALA